MSEIRIIKILIELNISLDCAVNFLEKHKDIRISKSPNTKISKEVYDILSDEFKLKSKEDVFKYKKKIISCLSGFLSVKERNVIRKKSTINSLKNFLSRGISQELKLKLEEENINYFIPPKKKKKKKKKNKNKNKLIKPLKIIYTPMGNKR
jgi:translation initiation factor IF-2